MSTIPDQSSAQQPLQLAWDGPKLVLSEEQGRQLKEAQHALLASQNGLAAERFWRQFVDEFLTPIHQLCEEQHDRVEACYVPFPKSHLRVFVVRRSPRYDSDLSDGLCGMEMDLFEKGWECEINQIPPGRLEMFFEPTASIQIYGNGV